MRRLILLSILNHAAFAGSRVVVSLAGLELQASPFAIGLVLSFYGLLPMVLSVASATPGDAAAAQGLRQSTRYQTSPSCLGQRPGLIQRSGSVTGTQADGGSAVGGPAEGASSWLRCRMCTPSPRAACTPVMRGAQPAPAWVDEAGAWPAAWG